MTTCDRCDTRVSTSGYLGGGIVCHDCARERREELEEDGDRPMNAELCQCEACGDDFPEDDVEFVDVPGDTLAFCKACTEPPLDEQYGVVR